MPLHGLMPGCSTDRPTKILGAVTEGSAPLPLEAADALPRLTLGRNDSRPPPSGASEPAARPPRERPLPGAAPARPRAAAGAAVGPAGGARAPPLYARRALLPLLLLWKLLWKLPAMSGRLPLAAAAAA